MDARLQQLQHWLDQQLATTAFTLQAIPGDASFRRYFRVLGTNQPYLAVDAPPATENNAGFIHVANAFAKLNLNVPDIIAADANQGFFIVSDLGNNVFSRILTVDNAHHLYCSALDTLSVIQYCDIALPAFDAAFMHNELKLFMQWVVDTHLQLTLTPATAKMIQLTFALLIQNATAQPQCCIHRDYHSRNLMLIADNQIGILDFQDAMHGPLTYDAVSLLRDCYVQWPQAQVQQWLEHFYWNHQEKPAYSLEQFTRWFDLMGMQRHLKASFIFARKRHRDGVATYLCDMPRTLNYLLNVSAHYPELSAFRDWLGSEVAPAFTTEVA